MNYNWTILLVWCFLYKPIRGWGDVGHGTVAYVAQYYFNEMGKAFLDQHLFRRESSDLYDAARWADKIRDQYPETEPWHYVDVVDDPLQDRCEPSVLPEACQNEGCIVSALEDMTNRARGNTAVNGFDQGEAIKFLFHFIGDLHMPLHADNYSRGGTEIHVQFDRHRDNLHSIWDTDMPHKLNNIPHKHKFNEERQAANAWARRLVQNNKHRPMTAVECHDVSNPQKCITQWMVESNRLNCAVVFRRGIDYLESEDLGGEYYEEAVPVIEEQIFKAGIRLAAWINALGEEQSSQVPLFRQGGRISGL